MLEHVGEGRQHEHHHEDDDEGGHADDGHRIDHRALDLALELGRLLDVARQPLQTDVEHAARLADGEHVHEQVVEGLGILAVRLGQRPAALHVVGDAPRHVAEHLGLALLGENLQTLRDGQTSVHHRRELPGVDRQVLGLDRAADLDRGAGGGGRLGLPLLDRRRHHTSGAQGRHGGRPAVGLDLASDGRGPRASLVREERHSPSYVDSVTRKTSSTVVVPSITFMSPD
jgi:hypothetical protein